MLRQDRPLTAVVGLGYWGRNLMRDFYRLGAVKSVWDADAEIVRRRLAEYPGPEAAPDFESILRDDEVSGVVLATPAATHYALGRRVLEAKKHLFVEKPLALTLAEGRELAALARNSRLILMVDHLLQNHPAYLQLRKLAEAGALGHLRRLVSRRQSFGKLRTEEDAWWSFAPHDISMILGLMGRPPESVAVSGDAWITPGLVDAAEARLDFGGGAVAHISVSWLHPAKEHRLIAVGEEKMAVFDDTRPWPEKLQLYPHRVAWAGQRPLAEPGPAEAVPLDEAQPLAAQARDFVAAMAGEKAPLTDGAEGLAVLSVLAAGSESLKNGGRPQPLAEARPDCFVHPTAVVEPGVKIGAGSKIWHFSHLLEGVELGENCNVGQNVVIGPRVRVGRGAKIQNNVSVYEGVTLDDEVFCGPSLVFTNVIDPRAGIARKHEYRPTRVGRGATLGANATIVCGHDLGAWCFIGAGAVVTADVPDHALMLGNPARQRGWVCRCGRRLADDLVCGRCGLAYEPGDTGLKLREAKERS